MKTSSTTTETSQRGVGHDADYITTHLLLRGPHPAQPYAPDACRLSHRWRGLLAPVGKVGRVSSDSSGFAELLAWITDHAPGPRVVVSIEVPAALASAWPARSPRPGRWWFTLDEQAQQSLTGVLQRVRG